MPRRCEKIGINLAYKLFRQIVVIKDQTCLPNSGKTYMYIRTSDKLVCPSRTRKKKSTEKTEKKDCEITFTIM